MADDRIVGNSPTESLSRSICMTTPGDTFHVALANVFHPGIDRSSRAEGKRGHKEFALTVGFGGGGGTFQGCSTGNRPQFSCSDASV